MSTDELTSALSRVAAALIERDGGELYMLPSTPSMVHIHLAGRFAGCPGNALVGDHVLRPLIAAVMPRAKVTITNGALIPAGAERVHSPEVTSDELA